tara:strand:+ start:2504 stop:4027 length:1524 start_codon:yes stop_codon:yes gene_type:complete
MTYQALYRKYRPATLDEVVGQEEAVSLVKTQLKNKEMVHAYLFSGPRGVGKTTLARIIAKELGCDPVFDVAEIDAASHNKVDDIRDLNESVNFVASSPDKKRVFILDEVHMLSNAASNAFLKTLEEPPEHVIFILATTEPERVLETIKSRTTHVIFKKIEEQVLRDRLSFISKTEKLKLNKEIINLISNFSDGSLRDAINIMEQGHSTFGDKVSEDDLYNMLGKLNKTDIEKLLNAIQEQDTAAVLELSKITFSKGIQPKDFLLSLSEFFRNVFHLKYLTEETNPRETSTSINELSQRANEQIDSKQLVRILDMLDDVNASILRTSSSQLKLEIFLMKLVKPELGTDAKTVAYRVDLIENKLSSSSIESLEIQKESKEELVKDKDKKKREEKKIKPKGKVQDIDVHWPKILSEAKEVLSARRYAYLSSTIPTVTGDAIILQVSETNKFLAEQINNDEELIAVLKSLVSEKFGSNIQVRSELVAGMLNDSEEDRVQIAQQIFDAEEVS